MNTHECPLASPLYPGELAPLSCSQPSAQASRGTAWGLRVWGGREQLGAAGSEWSYGSWIQLGVGWLGRGGRLSVGGIPLRPLGRCPDSQIQKKAPVATSVATQCGTCLLRTYCAPGSALDLDDTQTDEVWSRSALNLQINL